MKPRFIVFKILLWGIACSVAAAPKTEQLAKSKQFALEGLRTWAAFEAAVFASVAEEKSLSEKLFVVGLDSGRQFLGALQKNEIKQEDIDNIVPLVVLLNAQGPSEDFILGRIYAAAEKEAFKKFKGEDGQHITDSLLKKSIAREELRRSNAELLVASKSNQDAVCVTPHSPNDNSRWK